MRALFFLLLLSVLPRDAFAHDPGAPVLLASSWTFTPFIVIVSALVFWIYVRGAAKANLEQRIGFIAGWALVFLALQSPLDTLADDSFAVHQMQHLVIHALAPMLLALSAPAAAMLAGLPAGLRRNVYAPIALHSVVRGTFGVLSRPAVATVHFIATSVFWLVPYIQTQALAHPAFHDVMHFSMLLAGLFFWFCVFDPRSPPMGAHYGARIFALLAAAVVNVPLGAYLSYKETLLYPAYGAVERIGLSPLADERLGGMIQYVPGGMMFPLAVVLVLSIWHRRELRLEEWRRRGFVRRPIQSGTAAGGTLASRNHRVALILAGISAVMFTAVIVAGVLAHIAIG